MKSIAAALLLATTGVVAQSGMLEVNLDDAGEELLLYSGVLSSVRDQTAHTGQ